MSESDDRALTLFTRPLFPVVPAVVAVELVLLADGSSDPVVVL